MTYLLAKLLKDHKFPQSLSKEAEYYIAPNVLMHRKDIFQNVFHDSPREATTTNEFVYKPRLEELIETIDELDKIERVNGNKEWQAITYLDAVKKGLGLGQTPIEAVANLWIKLHE